jgi:hypothetical protein
LVGAILTWGVVVLLGIIGVVFFAVFREPA